MGYTLFRARASQTAIPFANGKNARTPVANEIIIIGSQVILSQFPNAPVRLLISMEADKTDGAIGEGSSFHELHGYYAQGLGARTAVLPKDWESRIIAVNNANNN